MLIGSSDMPRYNKYDFVGGLNQGVDSTKVDFSSEYYILSNARTRNNTVKPIHNPLDITTGLPEGEKIQGAYSINNYQLVFIAGKAYFKNFDPESASWSMIPSLQMSATVDRIYMELVPASYVNFVRKSADQTNAKSEVALTGQANGSPMCAIVMDGVSQPWIIFPNASARITQTYAQWSTANREYVPVATMPMYLNGKLYCVGKDSNGSFTQIYHSVSGRPLDFTVPVTEAGDKISLKESVGGAPALAYRVDFGDITALKRIEATDGAFFVATVRNSYLVLPDTTDLIYGEPTFSNQFLFNVGPLNADCLAELKGDYALIHYSGIRSFNGTLALKFRGKNSPFSRAISNMLDEITQVFGAATNFNNYAVFSLLTKFGPAILWYDTLIEKFVAFDQFPSVGRIRQFSVLQTNETARLFFYTEDNRLYEYDAGTVATARAYFGDIIPGVTANEHKITRVSVRTASVKEDGYVQVSTYADERKDITHTVAVTTRNQTEATYSAIPFKETEEDQGETINVDVAEVTSYGYKVGILLEWDAMCEITGVTVHTDESQSLTPETEKQHTHTIVRASNAIVIGNDNTTTDAKVLLQQRVKTLNADIVLGGGITFSDWSFLRKRDRFFAVPAETDLDGDVGEAFYQTMLQSPTRYFVIETTYVNYYVMNSGYDSSDTQVEPDNLDETTIKIARQWRWLKARLAESTKINVVFMRSPVYSSVAAKEKELLQTIPLREWGVHLVLSNAAKIYERIHTENLTYINVGTSGGEVDPYTKMDGSYKISETPGFLMIEARPLSLDITFQDAEGNIIDIYCLRK